MNNSKTSNWLQTDRYVFVRKNSIKVFAFNKIVSLYPSQDVLVLLKTFQMSWSWIRVLFQEIDICRILAFDLFIYFLLRLVHDDERGFYSLEILSTTKHNKFYEESECHHQWTRSHKLLIAAFQSCCISAFSFWLSKESNTFQSVHPVNILFKRCNILWRRSTHISKLICRNDEVGGITSYYDEQNTNLSTRA